MFTAIFEQIGLSPNEAKIYETLLSTGETSVSTISAKAKVHRRNVYDAMNRLLEKGLVFQIFQKGENLYQAVHPNKLLEVLKEKETALTQVLPKLNTLYEAEPPQEAAYIYKGLEGYKNYMRDLARVGQETYFLGAKGLWFTPTISQKFLTDFKAEMKRKKVKYYTLYDYRVVEKLPKVFNNVGGNYKILPKKYSTSAVCDIFGDYVVTFTSVDVGNVGEDVTVFVMINHELAESYKTWFRMLWDLCPGML
ncbi:MAG: helix-turn-helix domain-containing protein [Patescibacteria group bacterium]|jgi:sugar-specific transcriptional regulator TrmB